MLVGGAPAILRPIRGYRWVRLAAGSAMVLTRGREPHRRRELLVRGTLPLGLTDQWGQRSTDSRRGTALGVDLGVFSVFDPDFELIFRKGFPEIDLKLVKSVS